MSLPMIAGVSAVALAAVAWLLTYALHSTVLLGGAWALVRARVVRGEAAADLLWKAATVGGVVTATVQTVLRLGPLAGAIPLPVGGPMQVRYFRTVEVQAGGAPRMNEWLDSGPILPLAVRAVALAVLAAWITTGAVRVARLARAHLRLRRCLAGRREVDGEPARILAELLGPVGPRRVRLTCSEMLPGPVALGRAEICLPARVLTELAPAELHAILAHEAAHLLRRDPLWLNLLTAFACVFAFQPLNALALRRFREGAELLCDAWAVRATGRPAALARSIVRVAGWLSSVHPRAPLPAMVEGGSPFVDRVRRLTSRSIHTPPDASRRGAAWVLLLLSIVLAAAPSVAAPPQRPPTLVQLHRQVGGPAEFTRRELDPARRLGAVALRARRIGRRTDGATTVRSGGLKPAAGTSGSPPARTAGADILGLRR
ncbi:MAG TPA: M56 family metallopeptidase [Longimicrobium sp.]|nr:M56 family metallopeptidase [Longimicrobium sp.]